jgi:hypothetical protein
MRINSTVFALLSVVPVATAVGGCSLDQFRRDPVYANASMSCEQQAMVDDAEDGNDQVLLRDRRGGYLSTFVDTAGSTISPGGAAFKMEAPGAHGSKYAIHIKGKLAASGETYAGLGIDLRNPRKPYNASKYKGVAFLAKVGPDATTHVRFTLPDVNTDKDSKICTECFNDFGIGVDLTTEWTRFEIPFSELTQEPGWGNPRPPAVDTTKLLGLQWQVSAPGTVFDIWIDDVTFIGCP